MRNLLLGLGIVGIAAAVSACGGDDKPNAISPDTTRGGAGGTGNTGKSGSSNTSGDAGATWRHSGPSVGLPNVAVLDVHIGACGVTAFTYGRGAFRSVPLVPCGQ